MPTKTQFMTIAWTLVAIAALTRIPQAKDILLNDSKLFGIF